MTQWACLRTDILELFGLYSFSFLDEGEDYIAFLHEDGYFNNVEVLYFDDQFDRSNVSNEYSRLNYSVHFTKFISLQSLHNSLFVGFFNVNRSQNRLKKEYDSFVRKQETKLHTNKYKFIPCKYIGPGGETSNDIVEYAYSQLFSEGKQLIIIEAAAGYGKTCTSYEILSRISEDAKGTAPLITELSKNRLANIFKYVLMSEIEHNFRGLTSNLVLREIKEGRVPLIIDGFDELLSKQAEKESDCDDEDTVQTMLSTIAQLFEGESEAKVILTSRKTAIFAGEQFDDWADKNLPQCVITRIQLVNPTAEEWIGYEKAEILKKAGIHLGDIANPALLAFINSLDVSVVEKEFNNSTAIVKKYFNLMLTRERERQSLKLSVEEQYELLSEIAFLMQDCNYTSCSQGDLKTIIELALDDGEGSKLYEYIGRYSQLEDEKVPTVEEFINKLANHALLDRVASTTNAIGFINYFIFGMLLIHSIIENNRNNVSYSKIDRKYWSIMATAGRVCDLETRKQLFCAIEKSKIPFTPNERLEFDISLSRKNTCNYCDAYFESTQFPGDFEFVSDYSFINSFFSGCTFDSCVLSPKAFKNCKFFNCHFYNITLSEEVPFDSELCFNNCSGHEELIKKKVDKAIVEHVETEAQIYEKRVLEQFWRPGSNMANRRRAYSTLFRGFQAQENVLVSDAIQRLISRDILIDNSNCIDMNFTKMKEIREILGR